MLIKVPGSRMPPFKICRVVPVAPIFMICDVGPITTVSTPILVLSAAGLIDWDESSSFFVPALYVTVRVGDRFNVCVL